MIAPHEALYTRLYEWCVGDRSEGTLLRNLKAAGSIAYHKTTGDVILHRTPDAIYFRVAGIDENLPYTLTNSIWYLRQFRLGMHTIREWDHNSRRMVDNGELTWPVPDIPLFASPRCLLDMLDVQPHLDAAAVDRATEIEWARVQRVIRARSSNVPKTGRLPWRLNYLVEQAESSCRLNDSYWDASLSLERINELRAHFDLDPLPPYHSPIPGMSLEDLRNLAALAK